MGAYEDLPAPTRAIIKIWIAARRRFSQVDRGSLVQPFWGNPNLPHFRSMPDPQVWARFGIKTLRDIMPTGILLTFSQLGIMLYLDGCFSFMPNFVMQLGTKFLHLQFCN